ncbi:cysteine hydrolase [Devosia sp. 17-2-E-8]|nr:cysteine hydrolase [Devosia sp. 17-2-E-8]
MKPQLFSAAVHLCVDMQRLFCESTEWYTPWMERMLPNVVRLVEPRPERTVFTRFIPASSPDEANGAWCDYYRRYRSMTLSEMDPGWVALHPELKRYVPPAAVFDKPAYSPWWSGQLHRLLRRSGVSVLILSGGESDICVLATLLGAIDLGYRVILVRDALYGSADPTHDAIMEVYTNRFGMQLDLVELDEVLEFWRAVG